MQRPTARHYADKPKLEVYNAAEFRESHSRRGRKIWILWSILETESKDGRTSIIGGAFEVRLKQWQLSVTYKGNFDEDFIMRSMESQLAISYSQVGLPSSGVTGVHLIELFMKKSPT